MKLWDRIFLVKKFRQLYHQNAIIRCEEYKENKNQSHLPECRKNPVPE